MDTELIIISYNTSELTQKCISSAYEMGGIDELKICVVDNCSTDSTVDDILSNFPEVRLIRNNENLGYAKACNIGALSSESEFIILSNSDIEYKHKSIRILIESLADPKIAIAGPQQFFANGHYQRSAGFAPGIIQALFDLGIDKIYRNLAWNMKQSPQYPNGYIDGGVIALRKAIYEELGGMDEDFFFYSEEADLSYRAWQKGYRNGTIREAEVIHYRGGSSENVPNEKAIDMLIKSKKLFMEKHRSVLNRHLAILIERINYGFRAFLAKKGITIVPKNKSEILELYYKSWSKV